MNECTNTNSVEVCVFSVTSSYYRAEFIVTYKDGKVETFPHDKAIPVRINERIGGI